MYEDDTDHGQDEEPRQALEPVEQESILFHDQTIVAVRLADGRICVVLRWVCESMNLQPGGQVRKIERTSATAQELIRVKIQTRGGRQTMPAITLRGFSPWILSINPGEVKADNPVEEERIRALVIAYQEEAKDVLYEHFVNRRRSTLPTTTSTTIVLAEPNAPPPDATHTELATYHAAMSVWHRHQADRHAQVWRAEIDARLEDQEARIEAKEALTGLIPDILERLGQEKVSAQQQTNIRGLVKRLSELSGTPYQTIYWELAQAFQAPRYDEILESQYPAVQEWFKRHIEQARKPRGKP